MERDSLDGWRESITKYAGDCEYDPTAEAILAYLKEQELLKKKQEKEENDSESKSK